MAETSYKGISQDEEDKSVDLNNLIRPAPVLTGWQLRLFSGIMNSVFGWPVHAYIANTNLSPITNAGLKEQPSFYPVQPPNAENINSDQENLMNIDWQREYLKENSISSPHYQSIRDYHNAFMKGVLTPEELIKQIEFKIEESENEDPPLRCFTQLNWDLAREAASQSTIRYKNKEPISVLDGIPVGIKDELNIKHFRTNCGRAKQMPINKEDCNTVAALRSFGVVFIGITNMHEMGMGVTGINPNNGTARNPHNDQHITGGSSSGSAAAVSSGIVPFAIGTDGGGSVRIPTAFCGMQGIKPTFGRLDASNTSLESSTVTSIGVIATNVADVSLVISLMFLRASDPRFFKPGKFHPVRCISETPFSKLKFGTNMDYVSYCQKEIQKNFDEIKSRLPNIVEVALKELCMNKIAHTCIILAETAQDQETWKTQKDTLASQTKIVYSLCSRLSLQNYMQSSAQKTRAIKMFESIFKEIDILVTPTTACLPKRIDPASLSYGEFDEPNLLITMWFVYLANLCGLPSMSVNAGYSEDGLPIGLMLTAPWWREDLLFTAAKELETGLKKPSRFYCPVLKAKGQI